MSERLPEPLFNQLLATADIFTSEGQFMVLHASDTSRLHIEGEIQDHSRWSVAVAREAGRFLVDHEYGIGIHLDARKYGRPNTARDAVAQAYMSVELTDCLQSHTYIDNLYVLYGDGIATSGRMRDTELAARHEKPRHKKAVQNFLQAYGVDPDVLEYDMDYEMEPFADVREARSLLGLYTLSLAQRTPVDGKGIIDVRQFIQGN